MITDGQVDAINVSKSRQPFNVIWGIPSSSVKYKQEMNMRVRIEDGEKILTFV